MKKLFFAFLVLVAGAGTSFAQTNNAQKPVQEKAKQVKKANSAATNTVSAANTTPHSAVANKTAKHHKKAKKEKTTSGR